MSEKKHKGDHGRRAEKHAAAQKQSALYSLGVILAVTALIIGFGMMGWWDNLIGSILVVPVAAFGCMCVYDLALLLTACITFGEGMVNAGKNEQGQQMIFHASSVVRLEVRDKNDRSLPSDAPVYKNAELCFVMESGRVNRRKVSRLTAKQLAKVKAALEAEKKFDTTQ